MRAGGKGANFTALRHKRGSVAGRLQLRRLDSTTTTVDSTLVHQIDMDSSCYGIYIF